MGAAIEKARAQSVTPEGAALFAISYFVRAAGACDAQSPFRNAPTSSDDAGTSTDS